MVQDRAQWYAFMMKAMNIRILGNTVALKDVTKMPN
jgi:hypothetical protein